MWPFRKKTKQPKVLLNRAHIFRELMPIQKQPLSEEEMGWVRQSLSSRKDFVGFHLPQLFAVAKCPCGTCRTLGLEPVELPNLMVSLATSAELLLRQKTMALSRFFFML